MTKEKPDVLGAMATQLQSFHRTQGSVNFAFAQKIKSNESNIAITQAVSVFAVILSITALFFSTKKRK